MIGNPPYDVLTETETTTNWAQEADFFGSHDTYRPALTGARNLFKLFICRGMSLLMSQGFFSFIIPMSLIGDSQALKLRHMLFKEARVLWIEAFPQKDDPKKRVFRDAKLSTVILVCQSVTSPSDQTMRVRTPSNRTH